MVTVVACDVGSPQLDYGSQEERCIVPFFLFNLDTYEIMRIGDLQNECTSQCILTLICLPASCMLFDCTLAGLSQKKLASRQDVSELESAG